MNTYIALLRGINVGGHKKIKMAELKKVLEEAGLQSVQTYIQSGNILFKDESDDKKGLIELISNSILSHFGFEVPILLLAMAELKLIVERFPKEIKDYVTPNRAFAIVLDKKADQSLIEALQKIDFSPEKWAIDNQVIYSASPEGVSNGKLTTNFFEKKLKVTGTARNVKTMDKLLEMAVD